MCGKTCFKPRICGYTTVCVCVGIGRGALSRSTRSSGCASTSLATRARAPDAPTASRRAGSRSGAGWSRAPRRTGTKTRRILTNTEARLTPKTRTKTRRILTNTQPSAKLAFTRYRHCQCCMVYGMHKGVRVWACIFPNRRAIVLQQCGQCRRAGRMKGRLIRAHTYRSKTISCKCQAQSREPRCDGRDAGSRKRAPARSTVESGIGPKRGFGKLRVN